MNRRQNRREFLKGAAGTLPVLGGLTLTARRSGGAVAVSAWGTQANQKLHLGIIGVAGRGGENLRGVEGENIVVLCDVDENMAAAARKRFSAAKFMVDYRQVFDQKGLDAVVISTPDHTHAIPTLLALRAGLHVYCEKPLTHTVAEARLVTETAAKTGRVTQMGTQIHAGRNYRRVVELVQAGAIGDVGEVQVWCSAIWAGGERPAAAEPVPKGLHYDLWLGPAPVRPYHSAWVPKRWRGWWDFGGGALADMACHYTDLPFWALGLSQPRVVSASGPPLHQDSTPEWMIVQYEYPSQRLAAGRSGPTRLTWYHGGKRPEFVEKELPRWQSGVLFQGSKGMLAADYTKHLLLPEKQYADYARPAPTIPDSVGHHQEWIQACKGVGRPTCSFDYAGMLTEAVLLGNVSYRAGRPITWDAAGMRCVNDSAADRLLHKEYRKPWGLG